MNQLRIRGKAVAKSALRYTPAGVAVLEASFAHEGTVTEATAERTLAFEFSVIAIGGRWARRACSKELVRRAHVDRGGE